MAAPGLAPTAVGEKKYRLGPFLVGWYEASMRLSDKEFAELFEQFVIEGGGERIFAPRPGVLGVVPVRGSLKPEYIEREPHLDIDAHFQRHERFLVIPCVCKREVGGPARTQLPEADEALRLHRAAAADPARRDRARPGGGIGSSSTRLEKMGHVHLAFYGFTMSAESPQFVGTCNCCSCCCGVFHGQKLSGATEAAAEVELPRRHRRGDLHGLRRLHPALPGGRHHRGPEAVADRHRGACARPMPELLPGKSVVDRDKCIGCGVCVIGCVPDAIVMEPVSEEEWFHVPSSMAEWEEMRLEYLAAETERERSGDGAQ